MTLLGVSTECHKSSTRTLHCGWVGTQTFSSLCDFWEFSSPVVDLCLALLEFHPMYVELNSAKYWKAYPKQFWNSFSRKSTFSISVGLALLNSYLCLLSSESAILYLECLCLCCILGSVSRWKASNQRTYLVSLLSKMWSSVASCSVPMRWSNWKTKHPGPRNCGRFGKSLMKNLRWVHPIFTMIKGL